MWLCSQIGAREHYAIPRALHQSEKLEALYTDFWAGPVIRSLAVGPLRSLATRFHPELRKTEIVSWNCRTLGRELLLKSKIKNQKSKIDDRYREFMEIGKQFACSVRDDLKRRNPNPENTIFFGYDTGCLETLEWCRERGIKCVVDQMDPNRVEAKLVREEELRWLGWALGTDGRGQKTEDGDNSLDQYFRRREREWVLADRVVVNSRWSLEALVQQGVPREKLVVIPLCYETEGRGQRTEIRDQKSDFSVSDFSFSASRPLKVLFLGQVILRKGIQYLIEAAKLLQNEPVLFDVVGPIGISETAVNSVPQNVRFHGRATRDQTGKWYAQSDVFVLPTLSDGFALTQIEAMAHGLPVIATPNCGEVVTDGVDGFIVPARDASALAKAIQRYISERNLLASHRSAALQKSKQFSLARLQENLSALERDLIGC